MHQKAHQSDIIIVNHHLVFCGPCSKGRQCGGNYSAIRRGALRRSA
jgi:hypothetical protein